MPNLRSGKKLSTETRWTDRQTDRKTDTLGVMRTETSLTEGHAYKQLNTNNIHDITTGALKMEDRKLEYQIWGSQKVENGGGRVENAGPNN